MISEKSILPNQDVIKTLGPNISLDSLLDQDGKINISKLPLDKIKALIDM